ncbi:hypothetical protein ABZ319_01325 [Nocardia sp. NPDC005978]
MKTAAAVGPGAAALGKSGAPGKGRRAGATLPGNPWPFSAQARPA